MKQLMPIVVNLDAMMAERKVSLNELSERAGIIPANLSILKTREDKIVIFSMLVALCKELGCQRLDIFEYQK